MSLTCQPYDARAWQPFKDKANETTPSKLYNPQKSCTSRSDGQKAPKQTLRVCLRAGFENK